MVIFRSKTKRVIATAFKSLVRDMWLSMATTAIIVIALFTMATMLALDTVGNYALNALKEKVDISVQFKDNAEESKILELKKDLEELKEVKSVEYISKEQALVNFKKAHEGNEYIEESLKELGDNPLFAVLNIKANTLEQYKTVDDYLNNNENYKSIIEKVNFRENEKAIDNFSSILRTVKDGIFGLVSLFIFIGILVAFNTIRLAMYAHRKEIEIMRLVGASDWYIRMPFIIEGAIFGFLGCIIVLVIAFPAVAYISPKVTQFLPGFDLYQQFLDNFVSVAILLLVAGIGIGVLSSLIAIRRYLKV
jgi:cell division transport system permease protein